MRFLISASKIPLGGAPMEKMRLFHVDMIPGRTDECKLFSTDQEELEYWLKFFTEKLGLNKKENSVKRDSYAVSFYFRGWKFLEKLDLEEYDDSYWWMFDQLIQRGWEPFRWGKDKFFIKRE
jgi:hypothetical protein